MNKITITEDYINEDKNVQDIRSFIGKNIEKGVFRTYINALCIELYYNSRDHGKSKEFNVIIDQNTISINYGGVEFNPFRREVLENDVKGGGTYTVKQFWGKFSSNYKYVYNFTDFNELTFIFDSDFSKVNEKVSCKIEVNFIGIGRIPRADQITFPVDCKEMHIDFLDDYIVPSSFFSTLDYIAKQTDKDCIIHINIPANSMLRDWDYKAISEKLRVHCIQ